MGRCICGKCPNKTPEFTLFGFPNDKVYATQWYQFVNKTRKWHFTLEQAIKNRSARICHTHFEDSCFDQFQKLKYNWGIETTYYKLHPEAVPTILPNGCAVDIDEKAEKKKERREAMVKKMDKIRFKQKIEREMTVLRCQMKARKSLPATGTKKTTQKQSEGKRHRAAKVLNEDEKYDGDSDLVLNVEHNVVCKEVKNRQQVGENGEGSLLHNVPMVLEVDVNDEDVHENMLQGRHILTSTHRTGKEVTVRVLNEMSDCDSESEEYIDNGPSHLLSDQAPMMSGGETVDDYKNILLGGQILTNTHWAKNAVTMNVLNEVTDCEYKPEEIRNLVKVEPDFELISDPEGKISRSQEEVSDDDYERYADDVKGDPDFEVSEGEKEISASEDEISDCDSDTYTDNTKDDPDFAMSDDAVSEGDDDDVSSESEEEDDKRKGSFHLVRLKDKNKTLIGHNVAELIKVINVDKLEDISNRSSKCYSRCRCKHCKKVSDKHNHYVCKNCNLQAHCVSTIRKHISLYELQRERFCRLCDAEFGTSFLLKKHMETAHNPSSEVLKCDHAGCTYTAKLKKRLNAHKKKVHNSAAKKVCSWEGCGRTFKTNDALHVHLRIHTGHKPYLCCLCAYSCRQKASLNWHMKSKHPGEPFPKEKYWKTKRLDENVAVDHNLYEKDNIVGSSLLELNTDV